MKKRIAMILTALLTVFALASCSSGSANEEAIRETSEGFLNAIQEGDFEGAAEFCTKDAFGSADLEAFRAFDTVFYDALGISKNDVSSETQQTLSDFINTILENYVTGYEIADVSEEDGKATVNANITFGFDPAALENVDVDEEIAEISTTYMTENEDEIAEIYSNDGEDAMLKKVVSDILPEVLKTYTTAIMATGETGGAFQLTLEPQEEGGGWVITNALVADSTESQSE